jgi:hypothetical protein
MRETLLMLKTQNEQVISGYTKHCVDTVNQNRADMVEMIFAGAEPQKNKMKKAPKFNMDPPV